MNRPLPQLPQLPDWWLQDRHDLAVLAEERRALGGRIRKTKETLARLERHFETVVERDALSDKERAALDAVAVIADIVDPDEPWKSYTDCLGNAEAFADAVGEPIPELDDAIRAVEAFLEPPPPETPEDDDGYFPPKMEELARSTDLKFLEDHVQCLRDLVMPSSVHDGPERLVVAKTRRRWVRRHVRPPKPVAVRPKPEFDADGFPVF